MSDTRHHVESDDRLRTLRRYLLGEVNEMAPDPERQDELRSTMIDVGRIDELLLLRAIVRDLATEDPCNGDDEYRCALCGDIHGEHDEQCTYRRAREWVERHA